MSNRQPPLLGQRKLDHLNLCASQAVEARQVSTLLEEVHLIHQAAPELDLAEVDLSAEMLGKRLTAPLMITAMTGGVVEAGPINRKLARVCQRHGLAMGLGSQRPQLEEGQVVGYQVREEAPDILLVGNFAASQVIASSTEQISRCLQQVGADALAIHLNPAQELVQAEGDRCFRGLLAGIERLREELDRPVMVKEVGCGMSPRLLRDLDRCGIKWVDIAGLGGTSWPGVESQRHEGGATQRLGELLWDWGIPTAVSTALAARQRFKVVASGGIRNGLDAARSIALGAEVVGFALPALRALLRGGEGAVDQLIQQVSDELRAITLLTGSRDLDSLRAAPRVLGERLQGWLDQLS